MAKKAKILNDCVENALDLLKNQEYFKIETISLTAIAVQDLIKLKMNNSTCADCKLICIAKCLRCKKCRKKEKTWTCSYIVTQ
jgi:predicted nucleic acid-binding protein